MNMLTRFLSDNTISALRLYLYIDVLNIIYAAPNYNQDPLDKRVLITNMDLLPLFLTSCGIEEALKNAKNICGIEETLKWFFIIIHSVDPYNRSSNHLLCTKFSFT